MQNFEEQTEYFEQFENRELNNAHLKRTFSQNKLRFKNSATGAVW